MTDQKRYHPDDNKPFCQKCHDKNNKCDCIYIPFIIFHAWYLNLEATGVYVSLMLDPIIANLKDGPKELNIKTRDEILKKLTAVHPKFNKSLIFIEDGKAYFNDITNENHEFHEKCYKPSTCYKNLKQLVKEFLGEV